MADSPTESSIPNLSVVTTLFEKNCRDIPAMLRQSADAIEQEDPTTDDAITKAIIAVQITLDGQIVVYGWGDTNNIEALGTLQLGLQKLVGMTLENPFSYEP